MSNYNQREYQLIIFMSLVYGISDFYKKGEYIDTNSNSQKIVSDCFEKHFSSQVSSLISTDELSFIRNTIQNPDSINNCLNVACNLASGRHVQKEEQSKRENPTTYERLKSVFQDISLGHTSPSDKYEHNLFPLSLDKEEMFPNTLLTPVSASDFNIFWEEFIGELVAIPASTLSNYINSLFFMISNFMIINGSI